MDTKSRIRNIEERLEHLAQEKREMMLALEMATSLGDFEFSLNKLTNVDLIFKECTARVRSLFRLKTAAFYMVDERDSSFFLQYCDPPEDKQEINDEVDILIQDRTFFWTLSEHKAVFIKPSKGKGELMMHVLATASRVRGMFIGRLIKDHREIKDASFPLLTIVMRACAFLLESYELYGRVRSANKELSKVVNDLKESERELKLHREQLEMLVEQKTRDLYKSQQELAGIIQHSTAAVFLLDAQGRIITLNPMTEMILGLNMDQAKGKTLSENLPQDLGYVFQKQVRFVLGSALPLSSEDTLEVNGETRTFFKVLFPVRNEQSEVTGVGGISTDISERKNMEEELLKANRAKSQFLANMSHELRTPLNSIMGMTELLLLGNVNEEQSNMLNMILESSRVLMTMFSDLLDLSQLEATSVELRSDSIQLQPVLSKFLLPLKRQALDKGLDFHSDIDEDIPEEILADEMRLKQILLNLISNAIKFTDKGHVRVRVSREPRPPDSPTKNAARLLFQVDDTGPGIPEDKHDIIFESFTLAEDFLTKKHGGSGLGLAISHRLAQLMGGEMTVQSGKGKGSTFTFSAEFKIPE